MQMFLFAAGVGIILVALILNGRERQSYAEFQDRALQREGVTNLADLSLVMADLTAQLTETADKITSDLDKRAGELRELIESARQLASTTIPMASSTIPSGAATAEITASPVSDKERAVRRLAEQGADVLTIARQLNIGKGEVQLILDLMKTKAR